MKKNKKYAKKKCDNCEKVVNKLWKAGGFYYCYPCYKKLVIYKKNATKKTR